MPESNCYILTAENVTDKRQLGVELEGVLDAIEGEYFGIQDHECLQGGVVFAFCAPQAVADQVRDIAWRYNNGAFATCVHYADYDEWLDYAESM